MKKTAITISILAFGLFYLFSGIIKIIDVDNFLFLIRSYNIKQLLYLAPAIPIIEIVLGLMLVLRIRTKLGMLGSIVLLLFFTIVFSLGHFLLNIDDCGCFGGIDFLKMSTPVFYLRNGLLIAGSYYLYDNLKYCKKDVSLLQFISIVVIAITASLIIGLRADLGTYLKDTPYTKSNIDAYHDSQFLNKNINETIFSNYISTSKDSTYLIFVFSYNCPHCLISTFYLNGYPDSSRIDRIIGLTSGSRKEERFFKKHVKTTFNYNKLKNIEAHGITGFFPLSFYVEKDTIRFKIKGTVPKYNQFEELYFKEIVN